MIRHFWRTLRLPVLTLILSAATLLVFVAAASAQRSQPQDTVEQPTLYSTRQPTLAVAPTRVDLTGPSPAVGFVDTPVVFTATVRPASATPPFTFTWQADGQTDTGPVTSTGRVLTQTYTWAITGTQRITVTAENAEGGPFTDTLDITILAPIFQVELDDVSISGADSVEAGEDIVLTAVITPANATDVVYAWSPAPEGDPNLPSATYNFSTTGTQVVTLTASNVGGTFTATKEITVLPPGENIPLEGVTIEGPDSVQVNIDLELTAVVSPSNATTPITYTWTPRPRLGQDTSQASFRFNQNSLGRQTITVVATQSSGEPVTATKVITVTPILLTEVEITPPTVVTVDEPATFRSRIAPNNATRPLSYTWSPEPDSGQGDSQASYTFETAGTQTVTLVVQGPGNIVSDTVTVEVQAGEPGIALTDVEIEPQFTLPAQGGEVLEFTAVVSPANASRPITYTWSPTPTTGQGRSIVTYQFMATGTQTITVVATNQGIDGQGIATDTLTFSVVAPTSYSGEFNEEGGTLSAPFYGTAITFAPDTFTTTTNVTYEVGVDATPPAGEDVLSSFTLSSDAVSPTLPISFTGTISGEEIADFEGTFQVLFYDEEAEEWVEVPTTRTNGTVTFEWDQLGQFALVGRVEDTGRTLFLPLVRR